MSSVLACSGFVGERADGLDAGVIGDVDPIFDQVSEKICPAAAGVEDGFSREVVNAGDGLEAGARNPAWPSSNELKPPPGSRASAR